MARSLWKGAISFGLVHIPVEMYPATMEHSLDLTMLDKRDFSPVGFKRYNKGNDKEVSWDNIVKGYEYKDGEYVVLSEEDLRRANVDATQTIDILAFVDAGQVPLLYYDKPYYLAPGKGGDKVYALLRETLKKAGKIGIANVVIRVKQHLAALVCVGDAIVMNTLRYSDEIRSSDELKIPSSTSKTAAVSDKEVKMALALVEGMSEDWDPSQYHDSYREDVLALIEKKVASGDTKSITQPDKDSEPRTSGKVIDLVALLQQSLGKKVQDEEEEDEEEAPKSKKKPASPPPKKSASKTPARAAAAAKPKAVARTSAKAPAKRKAA